MMAAIEPVDWKKLEHVRVIFGHQSVGSNILEGVHELANQSGSTIIIKKGLNEVNSPGIFHFFVGENGDPMSKIHDFENVINDGGAEHADLALLKLCYIDFRPDTDAELIANAYVNSIETLQTRNPHTTIVASTVPIAAIQVGPKAWVKQLIGRPPAQILENAVRARFNQIVRDRFQGTGRLFDLARIEAEGTGQRTTITVNGRQIEVLSRELTDDGGHLNQTGKIVVANKFLNFIESFHSGP